MILLIFSLQDVRYSLDVKNVEEVVPLPAITPFATLPSFIRGIINLRGNAVPVIDLRKRLGMKESKDELYNKVVIVKFRNKITGLVVDKVFSVSEVSESQFVSPPEMMEGVDVRFMSAAIQMGSELLVILNLENILSLKESEELLKLNIACEDIKLNGK